MSVGFARGLVVAAVVLAACSGGGSTSDTDASVPPSTTIAPASAAPLVDEIDAAVTALEAQLGAKQQFFEINATSSLVNLIVALNAVDGMVAQPWVYLDGQLSSTEGAPASGSTFDSSALDFDPDKVLSQIETKLPQSSIDLFFIEGGKDNTVQYTAAVTSSQGGQLLVVVGPDGTVQSVDAS